MFSIRQCRASVLPYLVLVGVALTPVLAQAETIAMIGTGSVGSALGQRLTRLGHTVIYGSRDPSRAEVQALVAMTGGGARADSPTAAAANAEVVVLAIPWDAVESTIGTLGDLSGKIVVDPTNPRVIAADGLYDSPLATSNAAMIQAWAPEARVVKALTLIPAEAMLDPEAIPVQFVLPIAGDDPAAKTWVTDLLESMGIEVVDFGRVRHARIIELLFSASQNMRAQGTPARITYEVLSN